MNDSLSTEATYASTDLHRSVNPAELAERALAAATGPCLVLVTCSSTANVRWAANSLTTNGLSSGQELTVVAIKNGTCVGSVSRSGVGADEVAALVAQAEAAAGSATAAEDAGELIAGPAQDSFAQQPLPVTAADLQLMAERLGLALDTARAEDRELFGYAEQQHTTTYLTSSTGIRAAWTQPAAQVQLNGKSAGRTRSAWAGAAAHSLDQVDVLALADEVGTRLRWQERQLELPAGRHAVILPPSAVADLLTYAYWSADARSAHEGRSVFGRPGGGTRVGEQLTQLPFSLRSDPQLPGMECDGVLMTGSSHPLASVFDNGLALTATEWIQRGRLLALPGTRHSAKIAGLPHTPFIDNLRGELPGASGTTMDLVGNLDDGLLLTCLWYIREVDPQTLLLTGLTRDGVYRVRGGEVVGAVHNFRFNESPIELLSRITAAGATEPTLAREFGDYFPRTAMPPVAVPDFNFSSVSQAS